MYAGLHTEDFADPKRRADIRGGFGLSYVFHHYRMIKTTKISLFHTGRAYGLPRFLFWGDVARLTWQEAGYG